jgi:hypothetical protein
LDGRALFHASIPSGIQRIHHEAPMQQQCIFSAISLLALMQPQCKYSATSMQVALQVPRGWVLSLRSMQKRLQQISGFGERRCSHWETRRASSEAEIGDMRLISAEDITE